MINCPNDNGQNWDKIVKGVRKNVISKINSILKVDISRYIEFEKVFTPKTIEKNTQSYMGSLYGSSSNDYMSAFLRHPNFSSHIENLYFCGGSVHPGGGIPLCLLSAKIVSQLIKNK
jgi:phytoene dehydrogenase-like protein